ncbi:hypothetical protein [Leptospira inadai]|uniref:Lipoprotein n=2 Tax=Leptospira inadai serovar Lyme TaxID=293084 RepID=A0ABX4YNJ5_9LEPT|nr:hypothetical protein [Leptospira inadai]PNV76853.1 hypothetical protein BES34_000785 [Leptospira inadai serovar Lyme]
MNRKTYFKIFISVQFFSAACNSNNQYYRALTNGYPNPQTFKIFPERKMARGNLGQIIFVSPSRKTLIVRLGEEPNNNYQWPFIAKALVRELE